MDEIISSVMKVVRRHAEAENSVNFDDPDTDLSAIGFDSLKIVNFMLDIETSFVVEFPADMIHAENFRSARTVADLIRILQEREKM